MPTDLQHWYQTISNINVHFFVIGQNSVCLFTIIRLDLDKSFLCSIPSIHWREHIIHLSARGKKYRRLYTRTQGNILRPISKSRPQLIPFITENLKVQCLYSIFIMYISEGGEYGDTRTDRIWGTEGWKTPEYIPLQTLNNRFVDSFIDKRLTLYAYSRRVDMRQKSRDHDSHWKAVCGFEPGPSDTHSP